MINVVKTEIPDVVIVTPYIFHDDRGYFYESFNQNEFNERVRPVKFVQDNQSFSTKGTLRGLHYQKGEHAQSKLVRVVLGNVLDVAVDIRKGSPTFGKHVAVELSAENRKQLFIPRGFAHGFLALTDEVIFQYKCDNFYNKESEGGICYDDPDINIKWFDTGVSQLVISEKDIKHPTLKDSDYLFDYNTDYYKI